MKFKTMELDEVRGKWFMMLCYFVALRSRDPSTQVGAVLTSEDHVIRSIGWNDLPRKVRELKERRTERPLKYCYAEHAERNAIYNAVRSGVSAMGCTLWINETPCCDCARAIIQSGIQRVFAMAPTYDPMQETGWRRDVAEGVQMMQEAGVQVNWIDKEEFEAKCGNITTVLSALDIK